MNAKEEQSNCTALKCIYMRAPNHALLHPITITSWTLMWKPL